MGTGTAYIAPGSPWENPYVESFNGKLRDKLIAREIFNPVMEARILFDDWGDTYNRHRPHSAVGYLAPAVFAAARFSSRKSGSESLPSAVTATLGGRLTVSDPS
jgi:transposase InsO family protein